MIVKDPAPTEQDIFPTVEDPAIQELTAKAVEIFSSLTRHAMDPDTYAAGTDTPLEDADATFDAIKNEIDQEVGNFVEEAKGLAKRDPQHMSYLKLLLEVIKTSFQGLTYLVNTSLTVNGFLKKAASWIGTLIAGIPAIVVGIMKLIFSPLIAAYKWVVQTSPQQQGALPESQEPLLPTTTTGQNAIDTC
mmetsp:Transcript_98018/g.136160  ORF Transcript_98018/g.136160 Transcript_98018/m.136160 type:complete len:190 (-) Transcript_98018:135-704(-)